MPEPTTWTWLLVAGFAGLLALDDTGWPQAMVSRPFVAASVGGWLLGGPEAGMATGLLLELLLLPYQPLGGARCPDPGPAALVAGAAAATAGPSTAAVLAAALAGWAVSWLGSVTVRWHRRLAARLVATAAEEVREPRAVERRHLVGLAAGFVRGALLGVLWWIPVSLAVRAAASPSPDVSAAGLASAGAAGLAAAGVAGASASRSVVRLAAPAGATLALGALWWLG